MVTMSYKLTVPKAFFINLRERLPWHLRNEEVQLAWKFWEISYLKQMFRIKFEHKSQLILAGFKCAIG
jgi:hypothetical protein